MKKNVSQRYKQQKRNFIMDIINITTRINTVTVSAVTFCTLCCSPLSAAPTAVETVQATPQKVFDTIVNTSKKITGAAVEVYQTTVKARLINRGAGNCNNSNGHALEIMNGDKTNLNPFNRLKEKMTKSPNAKTVDAVVLDENNKVVERIQYKDTPESIAKTAQKVKNGQYDSATLKGTTETAEKFNKYAEKHGIPKRMQDTGISSNTTKTIAKSLGGAKEFPLSKAIATSAKTGSSIGAAISAGISVIANTTQVVSGEKTIKEAAVDVVKDTAGGAIAGAGATAAATVTGSALATGLAAVGAGATVVATAQVVVPTAVAIGTAVGISYAYDKICDKVKEKIEEKEQNQKKSTANPKILTEKRPDKQ